MWMKFIRYVSVEKGWWCRFLRRDLILELLINLCKDFIKGVLDLVEEIINY